MQMNAHASPLKVMCCAKALPEKKFGRKDSEDFCEEELLPTHVLEEETEALWAEVTSTGQTVTLQGWDSNPGLLESVARLFTFQGQSWPNPKERETWVSKNWISIF